MNIQTWFILKSSLILNLIGALMIAFSIGKNPGEASQTPTGKKTIYLASVLHPHLFKWGIIIMIIGFAIGLFDTLILDILICD